jgi:predicted transposase YbfD/YdcC
VARVAVSPEEIGLCACWQVLAIERTSYDLSQPDTPPSVEVGYYASSVTVDERTAAQMGQAIRGHWSAIENGTHYRRDVTLGEDACRVKNPNAAALLASLRNLANGLYELERAAQRTKVDTLQSWCQQQTFSTAWLLLQR